MSISKDKVRASLIINKDLKKRLEELAAKDGRSFNGLIIKILADYVSAAHN